MIENNNIKEFLSILDIKTERVTRDQIKFSYRVAAQKFHPDRNAAGHEMMKLINIAYEALEKYLNEKSAEFIEISDVGFNQQNLGDDINKALNSIINLGLEIEICGSWIWVRGNTKEHKYILKSNGYFWAPKKESWYFRPSDYKSTNRGKWSMDKIRESHGSFQIRPEEKRKIANLN